MEIFRRRNGFVSQNTITLERRRLDGRRGRDRRGAGGVAARLQRVVQFTRGEDRALVLRPEHLAPAVESLAEERLRLLQLALLLEQRGEVVDGGERLRVPRPVHLPDRVDHLAHERLRLRQPSCILEQHAQVAQDAERVRVPRPQHLAEPVERLAVERLGLVVLLSPPEQVGYRAQAAERRQQLRPLRGNPPAPSLLQVQQENMIRESCFRGIGKSARSAEFPVLEGC